MRCKALGLIDGRRIIDDTFNIESLKQRFSAE